MIQNFFILAFIAQICFTASTGEPIALDVYYETLCPDTIRFYKEQLYPAWEKLKDSGILSVEIYPYGNAKQTESGDGSWIFECQHGVPECELNLFHACVMKGPEGNMLMHEIADSTEALVPRHNYIPWMVVNNEHTDEIQTQAEFNLFEFICNTYSGQKPDVCNDV